MRNKFVYKGKKDILRWNTSLNFELGLHEIFGFHWFNLSSFVICFNLAFYLDKILKYVTYVKIFHEAKLQAFVKMKMTRNPEL